VTKGMTESPELVHNIRHEETFLYAAIA